ncbi:MAG: ABC transporter ATP-binding protein [Gammaproteobacteria bacterium]|nr:ABC transporter ATP-binding protein [Gammaproteobacteria bacterium]
MLSVNGLSKQYRSGSSTQTVFDNLNLELERGEVVALLGASGSGKTTLLNLLSGIDSADSGQVLIDGRDIHALQEPDKTLFRRQHLGFVFQFFNLIPTLTVGENVALPLELTGQEAPVIQQRVAELLERVGLSGMQDRYPETLSGGEQQRIAIARALAHHPRVLLADEPTGNLDEETGAVIVQLLTELARDQGTTMLIVTHSRTVADAADRVFQIRHGVLSAGE